MPHSLFRFKNHKVRETDGHTKCICGTWVVINQSNEICLSSHLCSNPYRRPCIGISFSQVRRYGIIIHIFCSPKRALSFSRHACVGTPDVQYACDHLWIYIVIFGTRCLSISDYNCLLCWHQALTSILPYPFFFSSYQSIRTNTLVGP
uniref:Uncharacterized protein n=1 Tax=Kalanchoe fedtschenkoi TaxID=63787 RepID=A0A7N0TKL0_KALFE